MAFFEPVKEETEMRALRRYEGANLDGGSAIARDMPVADLA